jgi:hypothetical protein
VNTVDAAITQPFLNLSPISTQSLSGTYKDLAAWTGISLADTPCQKTGDANPRFPIYLKQYNPAAQAQVYELFKQATTNASTPFSDALFMVRRINCQWHNFYQLTIIIVRGLLPAGSQGDPQRRNGLCLSS